MLQAIDVTFGYGPSSQVLQGINLTVEPGERVALVAPSGFGKTTLCQILAGYLQPSSGSVVVDGQPLTQRGVCPVQMIWQHPEKVLDPRMRMKASLAEAGTVPSNILGGLDIRPEWMRRFPHELSGGEMQRFCIARALATNPRYLIADEISTMLDAVTQADIWQFLLNDVQENQRGLIFVSHSPALVNRVATRVINLA